MDITLITIFIFKNTILKSFKSYSISDIVASIHRNNFDSCWRNIERYVSTLDNKDLTVYIISCALNRLTFGIKNLSTACRTFFCVIYSSQQILVTAERMPLNGLSHLTRIKCERYGAGNIYFTTNLNIFWQVIRRAGLRTLAIRSGILENDVPVLGCCCE